MHNVRVKSLVAALPHRARHLVAKIAFEIRAPECPYLINRASYFHAL